MFWQAQLFAAQMWLGEVTRQRPKRISFEEFSKSNEFSETRPHVYTGGTVELTPPRIWYGDYLQRAVERDSKWFDYIWAGPLAFLLDTITVAYRHYVGEAFELCLGPDTHVERVTIDDRLMFQAVPGTDNAGGGFLIDDPQAWGGDQPPGGGGEYAWCDITRGNYSDQTNTYLEDQLTTPPNKTPSLRGLSILVKRGPSGFTESGYIAAGADKFVPQLRLWKVVVRRQPDNLTTGFNKIGIHMNPMEVIYEWSTSIEYGAKAPLQELNLTNWRAIAQQLHTEGRGWSGKIEGQTSPGEVVDNVLAQIDGVRDFSPSLGLTIRLIRRDYSFGSLRVLNQDVITRVERFTPGTYEDTVNKIQVQFADPSNNHELAPGLYIDAANQQIQNGRPVPQTHSFLGVGDKVEANVIATRMGRAQSLPRAPLECRVFASWGRLSYRGEVVIFEWQSPSFTIVMRVMEITPNGPDEADYHLVLMEDQFATGLRTMGEPGGSSFVDPGAGLDIAPPSATWNTTDFPPDGLQLTLTLTNTNQFMPLITGGIVFGSYAPGGQYARIWVTEPGGVQTLSPMKLSPDLNNEATFPWPANAVGVYEFCVQTFSLRDATNGVKVCALIDIAAIGSPSVSPSASVSPSSSMSPSVSPSASTSPSPTPSGSVSPSASQSPSSSVSPSAPLSDPDFADVVLLVAWQGSDGQTTQIDLSDSAHVLTFSANAQIDTDQSLQGGSSLLLDGNEDRVTIPDHADFNLAAVDWTFEDHVYIDSFSLESVQTIISQWQTGGNERGWWFRLTATTLEFLYSTTGGNTVTVSGSFTFNEDAWYYVAAKRSGTSLTLHAALTSDPTTTLVQTHSIGASTIFDSAASLSIGTAFVGAINANDFFGWRQWTRVTRVARDVTNVPDLPFPTS